MPPRILSSSRQLSRSCTGAASCERLISAQTSSKAVGLAFVARDVLEMGHAHQFVQRLLVQEWCYSWAIVKGRRLVRLLLGFWIDYGFPLFLGSNCAHIQLRAVPGTVSNGALSAGAATSVHTRCAACSLLSSRPRLLWHIIGFTKDACNYKEHPCFALVVSGVSWYPH